MWLEIFMRLQLLSGKRLHQQYISKAFIVEVFLWIVRAHDCKISQSPLHLTYTIYAIPMPRSVYTASPFIKNIQA